MQPRQWQAVWWPGSASLHTVPIGNHQTCCGLTVPARRLYWPDGCRNGRLKWCHACIVASHVAVASHVLSHDQQETPPVQATRTRAGALLSRPIP